MLDGPLTLHLTAASDHFATNKAETMWIYLYDCPGGLTTAAIMTCTKIGSNKILVPKWNLRRRGPSTTPSCSVTSYLLPGRQLRVRLLIGGAHLWIPLVSPYQSSIDYTG